MSSVCELRLQTSCIQNSASQHDNRMRLRRTWTKGQPFCFTRHSLQSIFVTCAIEYSILARRGFIRRILLYQFQGAVSHSSRTYWHVASNAAFDVRACIGKSQKYRIRVFVILNKVKDLVDKSVIRVSATRSFGCAQDDKLPLFYVFSLPIHPLKMTKLSFGFVLIIPIHALRQMKSRGLVTARTSRLAGISGVLTIARNVHFARRFAGCVGIIGWKVEN